MKTSSNFNTCSSGFRPGELTVYSAGRQNGKSFDKIILNQYFESMIKSAKFTKFNCAIVDGEQWYTVGCSKEVREWIVTQPKEWFHEHIDETWHFSLSKFDMNEKLYMLLSLKWS
jgi:hypothetical protein